MRPIRKTISGEYAVRNQDGSIPGAETFRGPDTFVKALISPMPYPATSTCDPKSIPQRILLIAPFSSEADFTPSISHGPPQVE